ncbi:MAG: hypothetical protein AB2693_27570, partial [Candidatus Thiodiazotropha sp.]
VTRSPVAMDTGDKIPSPIQRHQDILSQQNDDSRIFNETTILEETVIGGQAVGDNVPGYLFDDPGSPV